MNFQRSMALTAIIPAFTLHMRLVHRSIRIDVDDIIISSRMRLEFRIGHLRNSA